MASVFILAGKRKSFYHYRNLKGFSNFEKGLPLMSTNTEYQISSLLSTLYFYLFYGAVILSIKVCRIRKKQMTVFKLSSNSSNILDTFG